MFDYQGKRVLIKPRGKWQTNMEVIQSEVVRMGTQYQAHDTTGKHLVPIWASHFILFSIIKKE